MDNKRLFSKTPQVSYKNSLFKSKKMPAIKLNYKSSCKLPNMDNLDTRTRKESGTTPKYFALSPKVSHKRTLQVKKDKQKGKSGFGAFEDFLKQATTANKNIPVVAKE
jgi:hypothetical protein